MNLKFRVFRYNGNSFVFILIFIVMAVPWFIITALFSEIFELHPLILFMLGLFILSILLSQFRYRNVGHLLVSDESISLLIHSGSKQWKFSSIDKLEIHYYYNNETLNSWGVLGGFMRYGHLIFHRSFNEESLDRIIINDYHMYIKIRNPDEAKRFENFMDKLVRNVPSTEIIPISFNDHEPTLMHDYRLKREFLLRNGWKKVSGMSFVKYGIELFFDNSNAIKIYRQGDQMTKIGDVYVLTISELENLIRLIKNGKYKTEL